MSRRRPAPRRSLAVALAVVAVGGAAAAAPAAAAEIPAKPFEPAPLGARPPASLAERAAVASVALAPSRLMVTLADLPSPAVARRRLDALGSVAPLVPEAGVWSVAPRDRRTARRRALAVEGAVGAEWSLSRSSDVLARPDAPTPLGPVGPFTDPLFTADRQWGLFQTGLWAPEITGQAGRPTIAILDSGIDAGHEEWRGPGSPLVAPRSTIRRNANAGDWARSGHGTHVAGIAAAPANGLGVVGVAPAAGGAAAVMPVQIADAAGRSTDETMIRGIRWAVRRGARVVNISAGGPGFSTAFQAVVLWATDRGALIVSSVGNEGDLENGLNYPAGYQRVLGVGAQCDAQLTLDCPRRFGVARFSNHNASVDVVAPGVNVISSLPARVAERVVVPGYGLKDGTSMAAPYAAGVAALSQANNGGGLSPDQLRRHLENTATDLGTPGRDDRAGHGAVNARAAVTLRAPADDLEEVNDDIKYVDVTRRPVRGRPFVLDAFIDEHDDREDVYAVHLRKGQRLRAQLTHRRGQIDLYLWRPGTRTVSTDPPGNLKRNAIEFSGRNGRRESVDFVAKRTGRHYLNPFARAGEDGYRLRIRVT